MIRKLRTDSRVSSLNVERYQEAADPRVYSIRASQSYRTIGLWPDKGKTMLLLWVDHHDEAYRWAKKKRFTVNPHTHTLHMWSLVEEKETASDSSHSNDRPNYGIFTRYTDRQLLDIGVPKELIPIIKSIQTPQQLDSRKEELPEEALEALKFLAEDEPYEHVYQFIQEWRAEEQREEVADDAEAFERAITSPASGRRIVVVTSDEQLNEILDQPMEKWRTFLHPSQRSIVEGNYRGPVRVLGGAGTGKTVVAMHRARRLVREVLQPGERLLFTTFNVNLAEAIRQTLGTMCTPSEMGRIDVISIDRLAREIVDRRQVAEIEAVVFDKGQFESIWEEALAEAGWPEEKLSFVLQEYEQVIQYHGVESWPEYRDLSRTGRGSPMTYTDRERMWTAVQHYRTQVRDLGWYEFTDILRLARKWVEAHPGEEVYRSAVADEVQDFHPEGLKLIRALVPKRDNDLLLCGDAHQRIYSRYVTLSQCGIDIRGQRSKRLRINYRTTEEIRTEAMQALQGHDWDDLDGGKDEGKDISLLSGNPPERHHFGTEEEERTFLVEKIRKLTEQGVHTGEIAVLVRKNKMVETIKAALEEAEIPTVTMTSRYQKADEGISCGTMHRSKGLEFRAVFLAGVNRDILPPASRLESCSDEQERMEVEKQERSLLYVAGTRARDQLYVTSHGVPSELWPVGEEVPAEK
ncbi:UvrD-like helicase family protein [Melghirimyces profundicolus]|uniref:DNA 3'-5' helicase n=1 Tax=Melghirimyces profundicolus TaxID=1242148 RepID=A0A2T6B9J4_9BACL|nr:3'-5' exonuclease [Melghirimyces profundicolus]PTX52706.1 UvrD-like helicase family protein [Melghirimyces profundicolus]